MAGKRKSKLESLLDRKIDEAGLPKPVREFRFFKSRRWRSDFAWPESKLLVEVEGGIWVKGAHTRGAHFTRDCYKYNYASILGYTLLRFTAGMIRNGDAIEQIKLALELEAEND